MKDIASALATPFLGDKELECRLFAALELQRRGAILDLYSEPESVVLLALYQECHRANGGRLFVGNLTETANSILAENGETLTFSFNQVGRTLRDSLGLAPKRVGRGYYLDFTIALRRKLHEMVRNYGIKRSDIVNSVAAENGYGGPPCKLCEEFGLTSDHEGKQLKFVQLPAEQRKSTLFEPEEASSGQINEPSELVNLLPVADTRREQASSAAREMRVPKPRQAPAAIVKRNNKDSALIDCFCKS